MKAKKASNTPLTPIEPARTRLTFDREPLSRKPHHNIALMAASLLPFSRQYQRLADRLPYGAILLCLPSVDLVSGSALAGVVRQLRSQGYSVRVVFAR